MEGLLSFLQLLINTLKSATLKVALNACECAKITQDCKHSED